MRIGLAHLHAHLVVERLAPPQINSSMCRRRFGLWFGLVRPQKLTASACCTVRYQLGVNVTHLSSATAPPTMAAAVLRLLWAYLEHQQHTSGPGRASSRLPLSLQQPTDSKWGLTEVSLPDSLNHWLRCASGICQSARTCREALLLALKPPRQLKLCCTNDAFHELLRRCCLGDMWDGCSWSICTRMRRRCEQWEQVILPMAAFQATANGCSRNDPALSCSSYCANGARATGCNSDCSDELGRTRTWDHIWGTSSFNLDMKYAS
jgi:hypothetical protein